MNKTIPITLCILAIVVFNGCAAKKSMDCESRYVVSEGKVFWKEYRASTSSYVNSEIKGADAATFKDVPTKGSRKCSFLVSDFAIDKYNVYRAGKIIQDSDPESFEVIDDLFSKDSINVYYREGKIVGADPKSFRRIGTWLDTYSIDRANVYFNGKNINACDVKSFEKLEAQGEWAKDSQCVYKFGKRLAGADALNFKVLTVHYGTDGERVYGHSHELKDVKPDQFVLKRGRNQDARYMDRCFWFGKETQCK